MSGEGGGLRGMLRKAAGLVVELPPEELTPKDAPVSSTAPGGQAAGTSSRMSGASPRTVEQIARDTPGPNLEDIRMQADAAKAVAPAPDGSIEFQAVYKAANVPSSGFTAEQVLDMMSQLPAELPLEAKRQTMKVSIGTMGRALGVTPETIVADASRKLAAITAYEEQNRALTQELVKKSTTAIAELEAGIAERKRTMELAQARAVQIEAQCKAAAERLDDVLEFFTQDVPPSSNAPGRA
jgi:hypothetical protein